MPTKIESNLQRDNLRKVVAFHEGKGDTNKKGELAHLKIQHSEDSKLLSSYVNKLVNVNRVYPTHLPTQASFRWSTLDPPITNWPRKCINPLCIKYDHEWTEECWSVRDILQADDDEILVSWDHDNIEGRIHDLIVNDEQAIQAHREGYDLHTLTCCDIFEWDYPQDRKNPHTSPIDQDWRARHNWQGKDTKQRVLAKNFNHGSKYTRTWRFVYKIQGIEKYGVTRGHLGELAKRYIESKGDAWEAKLKIMDSIQRKRIARTLYGARRSFYNSSEETGREGFSHMISGTVSHYNNTTLIMLHKSLGDNIRLLHNAHDGDKVAIKRSCLDAWDSIHDFRGYMKSIIERPIDYEGRSLVMTAGLKVVI